MSKKHTFEQLLAHYTDIKYTIVKPDDELTYAEYDQRFINLMEALGVPDEQQRNAFSCWLKLSNHQPTALHPINAAEYLALTDVASMMKKGRLQ